MVFVKCTFSGSKRKLRKLSLSIRQGQVSSPSLSDGQLQASTDCFPKLEQNQAATKAQHQMTAAIIRIKVTFLNPSSNFKIQGNTFSGDNSHWSLWPPPSIAGASKRASTEQSLAGNLLHLSCPGRSSVKTLVAMMKFRQFTKKHYPSQKTCSGQAHHYDELL